MPAIGALVFVVGVFVPAQWKLDRPQAAESVNVTVLALATIASGMVVAAMCRGARAVRSSRRLVDAWMRHAAPMPAGGLPLSAFVIDDPFPIALVAGVRSPKNLVARYLRDELTPEELDAVLAHEVAHHAARDNIKRILLECVPALWRAPSWGAGR